MKSLSRREIALALFSFFLGIVTTPVLQAAERNPFLVVDGDGWLTSNVDYTAGRWTSLNPERPAFGLELSERNDLPFDRGTAGATFWVHNPDCAGFEAFGEPCGWQLGLAITQFRSVVVGGQGIELDGLGLPPPYARIINSSASGTRLAGLLTNAFVDFSGVDSATAPSWFAGFELDRDAFALRRAPAGTQNFADLLTLDRNGNGSVAGSFASAQPQQNAPNQWATRAQLVRGRYTFRYAKAFAQPPVCVATPEGGAHVRVAPATDRCVVTSDDPHDTANVDVIVIGNPN